MEVKDFSTKNYVSVENIGLFGLFSRDKGDCIDVWMIKITSKQIKLKRMLASFKLDNIQKTCLSLKSSLFSWFICFVNLILADKHSTKNL